VGTRALLLWLGAALLGISALTFSAVAWARLGDIGHAVLLLAATTLSTLLAAVARRRLPMTAEAFVGLTVVLALVDVYAVRRAGLGAGLSPEIGWAIGTAAVLGFSAVLGRFTGRRTARFAVAALLCAPVVLLISPQYWPPRSSTGWAAGAAGSTGRAGSCWACRRSPHGQRPSFWPWGRPCRRTPSPGRSVPLAQSRHWRSLQEFDCGGNRAASASCWRPW
jgi:drug/metabolite transporter (DMT)-like permease